MLRILVLLELVGEVGEAERPIELPGGVCPKGADEEERGVGRADLVFGVAEEEGTDTTPPPRGVDDNLSNGSVGTYGIDVEAHPEDADDRVRGIERDDPLVASRMERIAVLHDLGLEESVVLGRITLGREDCLFPQSDVEELEDTRDVLVSDGRYTYRHVPSPDFLTDWHFCCAGRR